MPNGNVGIGTITPSAKISIETGGTHENPITGLRLVDGNQGAKKVLTSDVNGVATWNSFGVATPILGTFTWAGGPNINNTNWNSTAYLVLPPGLYTIEAKLHIIFDGSPTEDDFVRIYISDKNIGMNNDNPDDTAILGTSRIIGLAYNNHSETEISILYYNSTNENVTLYLNFQSDLATIHRSNYQPGNETEFLGVKLIENYFYGVPYSN